MRAEQSKTSFLWFIKDKENNIIKVFHSKEEAIKWLSEKDNK